MSPRADQAKASEQAIVDNVRKTLATTAQVLAHFEQSLLKSGFAEGSQAYRKMAEAVLGQRVWSASHRVHFDEEFAEIARRARAIHDVLSPYADAMLRLSAVVQLQREVSSPVAARSSDDRAPTAVPPAAPPPRGHNEVVAEALQDRVLACLSRARRPMSLTALCSGIGCNKSELLQELEALERGGRVQRRGTTRASYSLTSGITPHNP
jgi:hypothetical protein